MELLDNLKINQRMNELNRSVRDTRKQVQRTAEDRYADLKDAIDTASTTIRTTAARTDKLVRKSPWAAIGGVAAFCLIAGYAIGALQARRKQK